jgi:3'-phosphoadenosine 5'-phosphosulfate sulfotransferase (PAPS reductase)/FAD synthetase
MATPVDLLPLNEYDKIIVSYSGGKDSLACVLNLLELGVDQEKLQLWHQRIDGGEDEANFMDWPITDSYCEVTSRALDLPYDTFYQWRDGGFYGEMMRDESTTAGVYYDRQDGEQEYLPSTDNKKYYSTRLAFPQVSSDLSVRWCSAALKIDVMSRAINNEPQFKYAKLLIVTGERAEESGSRAKYLESELHRCNGKDRLVHHWRPIHKWSEKAIWRIIGDWNINAHPCYHLGYSRCSCMGCIFIGPDEWASVKYMDPKKFRFLAKLEKEFGKTIHRKYSLPEQVMRGSVDPIVKRSEYLVDLALSYEYPDEDFFQKRWELPIGAFKKTGGPT